MIMNTRMKPGYFSLRTLGELAMVGNQLWGETDGVPGADLVINLTGVTTLTVGAFAGTDVLL